MAKTSESWCIVTAQAAKHQALGEWFGYAVTIVAGVALGVTGALLVSSWGPGITSSFSGAEPKAYWYVSRAAGLVAYGLLWLSMALGLMITGRVAKLWPGGPAAVDLHEFTTLTALALAVLHTLVLLGDRYMDFSLLTLLTPTLSPYRAEWVVMGQAALYLAAPVIGSFYLRRRLGPRTWRLLHYLTFVVFALVTAHGVGAGSDSGHPVVMGMYLFALVSLYALTVYRILTAIRAPKEAKANAG
jgi:predicted ferric reductase